jgi:CBS-domain-containing membrane protein
MPRPSTIEVSTISRNDVGQEEKPTEIDGQHANDRCLSLRKYFSKWRGQQQGPSAKVTVLDCLMAFVGTFISISVIAVVHFRLVAEHDLVFLIASFGASAVLLYGLPASPLAQPRSLVGGQLIGAIVGCAVRLLFGTARETFPAMALTVAVSLFLMQITNTMHAPAGATALLAIMSSKAFPWFGFQFVLMPVLSGSLILLVVAVVVNNLAKHRHYPCSWW